MIESPKSSYNRFVYYVYILQCPDKTLYTGITTDVARRFKEHQLGVGARYTRAHGAKKMIYSEGVKTRSAALKREAAIKKMSRAEKLALVRSAGIKR